MNYLSSGERSENKAIQYLLDDNRDKVTSYVLKNSGDQSDASTVLVEGVTNLVFNLRKEKFKGESKLSTYLFSICRLVWLKELKKRKKYTNFNEEEDADVELIDLSTPIHYFNEKELKEEVALLLEQIGTACKKVLEMWSRHYSMTEISAQLGYKNSQIAMNKKNKCLTKLKSIIADSAGFRETLKSYLN